MIENKLYADIEKAHRTAVERLMGERNPAGFWEGRLSSSALATGVAVFALARVDIQKHKRTIHKGLDWLSENINEDGGYGDSPDSRSNLSTTLLCWSALSLCSKIDGDRQAPTRRIESWLRDHLTSFQPQDIASAVLSHYGDDRTFSAPILTLCALSGRMGPETTCWCCVPQLPFELAVLPHRLFKWLRLPVVSYAIPALIAIGLTKHRNAPSPCPVKRGIRHLITKRALRILESTQPENGGFLEATPLTAFVVMSLGASGLKNHIVARRGTRFILESQREDGSWAIDTNLSTWLTTLSVKALHGEGKEGIIPPSQRESIKEWLLSQQFAEEHPFTHAPPGGWSWTDLPGGVPDADDTSGALLALRLMGSPDAQTHKAASRGIQWLMDIQNRDGGIPTFCKGWGRLVFDKSCPDITAHAVRAFAAWREDVAGDMRKRIDASIPRAIRYLRKSQRTDGAWTPLWFGNQW